jgi:DNA-binding NarL/FixJ family response regulator
MARRAGVVTEAWDGRTGRESPASSLLPLAAFSPVLTKRENEVLLRMAAGLQNRDIARELGISLATARNHTHNILEKLDVHSRLQAVSLAFQQGWVKSARQHRRAI